MAARLLIIFLIFTSPRAYPQYSSKEKQLLNKISLARNDEERITAMGELASFYYIFRAVNKGDSVLQKQLLLAEMSNNKKLIFNTLFSNAVNNFFDWSSSEAYNKALAFLDKGLSFAAETGDKEYEAIAHSRKAMLFRKREDYNNALEQTLLAIASAQKVPNDSLKSAIYIEAGDVFLGKRDFIPAYKNFNLAFDLAYAVNNVPLQSELYHRYSDIYHALSDSDEVIRNLLKSLDLNKTHNNPNGLMKDYFDLARMSEKKEWIDTLIETAEKVNSVYYSLQGRRLLFAYIMVIEKDSKKALAFLRGDEELNQSYLNMGVADYNWTIGNVFKYAGQPDSAIWYFNLGKAALEKTVDASIIQTMNKDIGECYGELKQSNKAIECLEKAMAISDSLGNIFESMGLASQLGPLYAETGDYKKAYEINRKKNSLQDSLGEQSKQKNVLRLELERQNSIHEKDLADLDKQASRIREIQYVGISIAIASIFMFILLLGMFPVSKLTIRLLSFMAFICLFEFIVLLIDNKLHKIFHGEPLKIWLVKIGLIAVLVPTQHIMEHACVRFLASQRLLRLRQTMSLKRLWMKLVSSIKKPKPVKTESSLEEDTAVL